MTVYQDILYRSRPISHHPKMSVENRAKLFTPFSALRGFDIEILTKEQDRLLVPPVTLAEDQQELILRILNTLTPGDPIRVTHFVPVKFLGDQIMGEYVTVQGRFRRVNDAEHLLVLEDSAVKLDFLRELCRITDWSQPGARSFPKGSKKGGAF
ncbi:MAG: hypothetical protein ACOYJZ_12140 [Acutalibacter sp.]|jgi:hypothetical protein